MKIKIKKIDAAKSQLIEAINLFFDDKDPISIHTLVGASLQILNDYAATDKVIKHKLLSHYDTIYIKDECRKLWYEKLNEARNFFKHADRDIKHGKELIEFETDLNELFILEAIRCLKMIEKDKYKNIAEFECFAAWFFIKYPDLFEDGCKAKLSSFVPKEKLSHSEWKEVLRKCKSK